MKNHLGSACLSQGRSWEVQLSEEDEEAGDSVTQRPDCRGRSGGRGSLG